MKRPIIFILTILSFFGAFTSLRADLNSDPWQINVYAINGIGSSNSAYSGASFAGIAGSGGSSYLNSIGLDQSGAAAAYVFYSGGNLTMNSGGSNYGGLNVSGNLGYNNASVTGNINAAGNLTGNGAINGNVKLGGTNQAGSSITVNGTLSQNQTYTSALNNAAVSKYFQNASSFWAGLQSTATWSNVYGQIVVSNLQAGRNVVNITLAQLNAAWGVALTGSSSAFVVFNILDTSGTLNAVSYSFSGGIGLNNVLFNLPNSTSLSMSGGTYASVLAPSATITFNNGMLQGNLVANNLLGSGSTQSGAFTGYAADESSFNVVAPEPSTYLMLGSFLALTLYIQSKRRVKA